MARKRKSKYAAKKAAQADGTYIHPEVDASEEFDGAAQAVRAGNSGQCPNQEGIKAFHSKRREYGQSW